MIESDVEIFETIVPLREFVAGRRRRGGPIVLVPTMGALHQGHGECVRVGRKIEGGTLVVSIFVNRTQFAAGEDLATYPRTPESDLEQCRQWGVDAVFLPGESEMYPSAQRTWVSVEELTDPLCGRVRPGHFRGVATVVTKLFNVVMPDVAVFGQKDAQQALVIKEMVEQLNIPVEVRLAATVREPDGLAISSRNRYLSPEERTRAAAVYGALSLGRERIEAGERDPARVAEAVVQYLRAAGVDEIQYAELRGARDLCTLEKIAGKVILAVAVKVGKTRLIDNAVWDLGKGGGVTETLLF